MADKINAVILKLEEMYGVEKWLSKNHNVLDSLIKTILSQSTSDWNRDLAWQALKKKYPTWEEVMLLSPGELAEAIRSGGLANQKAQRILDILLWIQNEYGELNLDFICKLSTDEAIAIFTQLKGIGVKTISVVLAFACGKDVFPVDTHVHRLCRRFGFVPPKATPEKTYQLMQNLVPEGKAFSFHINLLKHGRQICKAQNPLCGQCLLFDQCEYEMKSQQKSVTKSRLKTFSTTV
ncbi:MAG: endonuclease III domain-containing protein [bacterium]